MPYAENRSVRIHYQAEGEGPPLLLHHGFTESVDSWRMKGFVEALAGDHRLIMIDSRGHGASDKPHYPEAYGLRERTEDVLAVLDALGIERTHYFGYSLGGWVGFGLAKYAAERVHSLAVGGAHPYGQTMEIYRQLLRDDAEALLTRLEQIAGFTAPSEMRERFLRNDVEALRAAYSDDRPDISDIIPTMTMPCLLFAGSEDELSDGIERCAQALPNGRYVELADLNHLQAGLQLTEILPRLKAFLRGYAQPV